MLAALVEGFFCIWVLPTIGRWFVAPFQKTQGALVCAPAQVSTRLLSDRPAFVCRVPQTASIDGAA